MPHRVRPAPRWFGALRGLTRRGAGLLAVGAGLVAGGLGTAAVDLVRVGVLLLALPLVAVASVARTRYRVSCTRSLSPARVAAATPARVTLRLENVTRLPTAVLLAEDSLPYTLGGRPRFTLDRVEPGGVRSATYAVRSEVRGRFTVGPLTVRLTDPFGLVELSRSFTTTDELVVTPVVVPLPAVRLGGEWTGGGEARSRSVASVGEDDVGTRAYRQGDDLRRVHWRSTARAGELMVRREEQPWQSRAVLLLDARSVAHRGEGATSSFEAAVSVAASMGVHLARRGYALRVLRDDGSEQTAASPALAEGLLLEDLSTLTPSRGSTLQPALSRLGSGAVREGLVLAVCGLLDEDQSHALARARGTGTGVAVLLDVASWSAAAGAGGAAAGSGGGAGGTAGSARAGRAAASVGAQLQRAGGLLSVAGWRVLVLRRGDDLASLWPRVGLGDPRGGSPFTGAGAGAGAGGGGARGGTAADRPATAGPAEVPV